jgi:hypothetical protein
LGDKLFRAVSFYLSLKDFAMKMIWISAASADLGWPTA